jgi:RNA recognition motif-containing protein
MAPKHTNKIRNFFVGNISYQGTEAELLEFLRFSTEADLSEVKICLDKETGKPRGFGFVTLGSRETLSIDEVIRLVDGQVFHGRALRAAQANNRDKPKGRPTTPEEVW